MTAISLLPAFALADTFGCPYGGGFGPGRGMGFFSGGGSFMLILTILLIVGLGIIIFNLVKNKKGIDSLISSGGSRESMEILKKRLARGEISEDEYDRLKEKLNG